MTLRALLPGFAIMLLSVLAPLTGQAPAAAQSQLQGTEGRIIILDASGSMRQSSFATQPATRWDQAVLSLEELVSQLADRDDAIPTAFHIFGDRYRWQDVQAQYASPRDYPANGPLCQDAEIRTDFAPMSSASARQVMDEARAASPSGMTPIPLAMSQALATLDPEYGGTIILVSDMDEPNCVPPGDTLCSAIEDMLGAFRRPDGRMLVEFRVLATPVARLGTSLADCAPTTTFELPVAAPDHEATVTDLLGGVDVIVGLRATGEGVIDPLGIDPRGITVSVLNATTGREVATGPPGKLSLSPGVYEFHATTPTGSWSRTETVTAAGAEVEIEAQAGRLRVSAVDASGAAVTDVSRFEIAREDGTVVFSRGQGPLPLDLFIGRGTYIVRASAPGLGDSEARVPVELTAASAMVLNFAGRRSAVEVTLDLALPQPTLPATGRYAPEVVLSGGALGSPVPLVVGATVLDLEPGRYSVTVDGVRPHVLDFEIPRQSVPYVVELRVPPGRIVAEAAGAGGQFELLDSAGTPIHSFDGTRIAHSLASGSYRLVHRSGDGTPTRGEDFTLGPGDLIELQF